MAHPPGPTPRPPPTSSGRCCRTTRRPRLAVSLSRRFGVFSAPSGFYRSRRIAIVARVKGDKGSELARGTATIELDPVPSWVPWLGIGWVVLFGVVLSVILWKWERLCPQCTPPGISVSPPVVTLGSGQAQQFLASAAATWTNTVNAAGLYIAPSKIRHRAARDDYRNEHLRSEAVGDGGREIVAGRQPQRRAVEDHRQAKTVRRPDDVGDGARIDHADLAPAGGWRHRADRAVHGARNDPKPQSIIVLAQAQVPSPAAGGAPSMLVAGSLVSVVPEKPDNCPTQPESGLWGLVLLVGLVGALGGLTHAIGSFGTYVGNRELKASWLLWYSLKPVLSAAVAVLVYFVFRAGLGAPDLGLGAGDCLKIAGFAGLVGLFAEQATVKLKDIFEAILTPRRDPREDKAGEAAKNTAKTPGADKPAGDQKHRPAEGR